jgi:hypothetical protein
MTSRVRRAENRSASDREEKGLPWFAEALCSGLILVAATFMTDDNIAVRAMVTDRYFPAPAIIAIAFMPVAPVLVTIGADAGRPDAGMSPS